jgi:hypothetical protein
MQRAVVAEAQQSNEVLCYSRVQSDAERTNHGRERYRQVDRGAESAKEQCNHDMVVLAKIYSACH